MNRKATFLQEKLNARKRQGNLRNLRIVNDQIDFASNDYLGLASNPDLKQKIKNELLSRDLPNGSTGSRLISGNNEMFEALEDHLAKIFKSEACLIFNSGYQANLAVVSCLPQRSDTILYDEKAHVCIKEGARLSLARSYSFRHNDLDDLKKKIGRSTGNCFIVTESVFSMDGDIAPLEEILDVSQEMDAYVIVDEAHSTGIYGKDGAGYLIQNQLEDRALARIYTFGKAIGSHGACVCGDRAIIDYLINFGAPFIYTTALPAHSLVSIKASFEYIVNNPSATEKLWDNVSFFKNCAEKNGLVPGSDTPIQPIMLNGNEKCKKTADGLFQDGFFIKEILSPTVKTGEERLRISIHSHNTQSQITDMVVALAKYIK